MGEKKGARGAEAKAKGRKEVVVQEGANLTQVEKFLLPWRVSQDFQSRDVISGGMLRCRYRKCV